MRVLITGVAGFAGRYLAEWLAATTAWELVGTVRAERSTAAAAQPTWATERDIQLWPVELTDYAAVTRLLGETAPDLIFHLAAQAIVQKALAAPEATLVNNIVSQLNLLRGVREVGLPTQLLLVGSAEEYGHVQPTDLPVNEDTPFRPDNPYAVSKIATDMLGLQYHLAYKMPIIRVRPFNHIGPRQQEHFVTAAFARQVARIEAGQQPPVLQVGNLNAERDFTDVRDRVRAYHLAATRGTPGAVYTLGSGRATPIRTILDMLLGLSRVPIEVQLDPARMRPADVPAIVCDPRRFHDATGWQATIPLEQSLADILDYWRARVAEDSAPREETPG